ncbi:hypothetical protein DCAR_0935675 [Daucus carota subsp. sativus]|uniref:Uncharacterized protein n=1 Tax=Daucus carota subsp. sativus TaxID=79200 RepID=A0AAF0Y1W6_DAUCS|nr:PREDICTED: uncharacterized protein LOC108202318 [Daucus carota subsp. sativus]WOH16126.1 hypothetical protein DCAR_0935675 [Daucus carota subsp. sativus]
MDAFVLICSARQQLVTTPYVNSKATSGSHGGGSSKSSQYWSPKLHRYFLVALEELGGAYGQKVIKCQAFSDQPTVEQRSRTSSVSQQCSGSKNQTPLIINRQDPLKDIVSG